MRTTTRIVTIVAGLVMCLSAAQTASACPMCKLAAESDARLPKAYMYSILFMMGMPMTISTGFGLGFWRLSRKAARMQREAAEHAMAGASDPVVEATQESEPRATSAQPSSGLAGPGFVFP
ncbi:MAG TPA: hypothetical protein VFG04_03095 [Planctomycetaceae bacterium]|nr:hypothetical protein [Planctomycetaceae bacterium]